MRTPITRTQLIETAICATIRVGPEREPEGSKYPIWKHKATDNVPSSYWAQIPSYSVYLDP